MAFFHPIIAMKIQNNALVIYHLWGFCIFFLHTFSQAQNEIKESVSLEPIFGSGLALRSSLYPQTGRAAQWATFPFCLPRSESCRSGPDEMNTLKFRRRPRPWASTSERAVSEHYQFNGASRTKEPISSDILAQWMTGERRVPPLISLIQKRPISRLSAAHYSTTEGAQTKLLSTKPIKRSGAAERRRMNSVISEVWKLLLLASQTRRETRGNTSVVLLGAERGDRRQQGSQGSN